MVDYASISHMDISSRKCGTEFLGKLKGELLVTAKSLQDVPAFIHYCAYHEVPALYIDGRSDSSLDNINMLENRAVVMSRKYIIPHDLIEPWYFAKRMVPHSLLASCHNNILQIPDEDLFQKISSRILKSQATNNRKELSYNVNARNQAFMICALTEAINFAALTYRNGACRNFNNISMEGRKVPHKYHATGGASHNIRLVPGGWILRNESLKDAKVLFRTGSSRKYFPTDYDPHALHY